MAEERSYWSDCEERVLGLVFRDRADNDYGWCLLANDKTQRVATVVPIEGSFKDPKVNAWATVGMALRNAFIQALFGGLEGTISMADVETVSASEAAPPEEEKHGLFHRKKNK